MFAYCLNNPVTLEDSSGSRAVINDSDLIAQVDDSTIIDTMGWEMEVQVSGPNGDGRLDLYDKDSNSYYEVKSRGAAYTVVKKNIRSITRIQMEKYDAAEVVDKRFPELSGVSPNRGMTFVSGEIKYGIWDVSYQWERPGLIVYDVKMNPERAATAAITGFAIIGMAVYSGGLSLPYTAPAFALLGG